MYSLNKIKTKRFTYKEIMECFNIDSYTELKDAVDEMIGKNEIKPIKSKGMTSFLPRVYCEYKKIDEKKDYAYLKDEIVMLHPNLNISRYLNNPAVYEEFQEQISKLSEFLWNKKGSLTRQMPVKERSFEIWGDEKFLESKDGKSICSFNKLDNIRLNYYYAPEPFFCMELKKKNNGATILIIENKDTWYSIGKALNNSENKLFYGTEINLLIYGEGNKATRNNAVTDFINTISDSIFKVYYAGDIDIAGVNMMYDCIKNNEVQIEPFLPLYRNMINAADVNKMNKTEDNRSTGYYAEFLSEFDQREQNVVKEILDNRKRIPQEILNYQDYIKAVS